MKGRRGRAGGVLGRLIRARVRPPADRILPAGNPGRNVLAFPSDLGDPIWSCEDDM